MRGRAGKRNGAGMAERRRGRKGGPEILRRDLDLQRAGPITLLEAIERPAPEGGGRETRLEMFLTSSTAPQEIRPESGWRAELVRSIGNGAAIRGWRAPGAAPVLSAGGHRLEIAPQPPEEELLAGLDTALALRNGISAETLADWLKYHAEHHRLQAALILERGGPAEADALAEALAPLIAGIAGLRRILLVGCAAPLGRAELPFEAHPFNAPDAPGKDRMELPPPDPMRAPLGEMVIFEALRARFLGRCGAVMNIEPYDLLAPEASSPEASIFDRARAASSGVIALQGRRCYPWRLRKGRPPRFGDHICRPFDSASLSRRWCIAPQRAPEGAIWRLVRIVGATPAEGESAPFHRCMSLRHPDVPVSRIVPKSSLVEEPALLALAREILGHKPVRLPAQRLGGEGPARHRATIVTTMKNEGPFILEWLAYHRAIGISDFLVYTNDCTDGTDTMLALLQEKGLVQHRENPFRRHPGLKPQHAALQAADREELVKRSDWLICMDVDEFINIHAGEGRLDDLLAAVGDANMISMTWRLFGNADIDAYEDRPIIEQFTRCAPLMANKPHQAWGFKTLFRNLGIFRKLGVHRPKGLHPQLVGEIRWVNGSGRPMPARAFRNSWRSTTETVGYDLVTLNHYALRSAESFLVKRDRGRVNHVSRDQGLIYWFRMNHNAERDLSIQRMIPAMRAELARLMADPEIRAAHEFSVKKHREKIAELKARPDYAAFHAELTGARLRKLSRMLSHFGANVFHEGPGVIPEEIVARDPSEDFFFTVERRGAGG